MKTKLFTATILALGLSSCFGGAGNQPEYLAVKIDKGDNWSIIKLDGEVIVKDEFDERPSSLYGGIFRVQENGGYSLYTLDKKPKVVKGCDELSSAGAFVECDLAPIARKTERISVIDKSGNQKFVLGPIGDKEIVRCQGGYIDGLLLVCDEDDKWGTVDKSGKLVLKCKYDQLGYYGKNLIALSDGRWSVINQKGETKFKLKEGWDIQNIGEDDIVIRDEDGRWGFVNNKGELSKAPASVKYIGDWCNDLYVYVNDEWNVGVMRRSKDKDEKLISAKYESLTPIQDWSRFLVKRNGEYSIIDHEGETVVKLDDYKDVSVYNSEKPVFLAEEGSDNVLLNGEGKHVSKAEYYDVSSIMGFDVVYSDYLPVEKIVKDVESLVTSSGIAGVAMESSPRQYLSGSASSYSYSYFFNVDKDMPSGYGYSFSLRASAYRYISQFDYWASGYVFNNDNWIDGLTLTIYLNKDAWSTLKPMLVKAIEDKGYSKDSDNDNSVRLTNSSYAISISKDYYNIKIHMSRK